MEMHVQHVIFILVYTGIQFVDFFCKMFVLIVLLIVQIMLIYTKNIRSDVVL
jgi:hypothetical protein